MTRFESGTFVVWLAAQMTRRGWSADDLAWAVRLPIERVAAAIAGDGTPVDCAELYARLATFDVLGVIYQYRDDLRHGVPEESRARRLDAVEIAIARIEQERTR